MTGMENLLGGPEPTLLPMDSGANLMAGGAPPEVAARKHPDSSAPWAALAGQALAADRDLEAYAFARTGYHRGLDALRRNGWKGHGPVPWDHAGNQGFLRALHHLGVAAGRIGEEVEEQRCAQFLDDCDPAAAAALR
jgi:hypothetical protein